MLLMERPLGISEELVSIKLEIFFEIKSAYFILRSKLSLHYYLCTNVDILIYLHYI